MAEFPPLRILASTDFSPLAGEGVAMARDLATRFGGRVHRVHAPAPVETFLANGAVLAPARIQELLSQREEAIAKGLADEAERLGLEASQVTVREGEPGAVVAAVAEEMEEDLVVVGSHGWTGLRRLLLGSVAEDILRRSTVPVLVVGDHDAGSPVEPGTVVVGTDLSEQADKAMHYAARWAKACGARLRVVYVIPPGSMIGESFGGAAPGPSFATLDSERLKNAKGALDAHLAEAGLGDADREVVLDQPWSGICAVADTVEAGLVVVGSHGRGAVARALLGSVAERTSRLSERAVLIVR